MPCCLSRTAAYEFLLGWYNALLVRAARTEQARPLLRLYASG